MENRGKPWKTVENRKFGARTSCYSSKFKILNSKFEYQASWCITNLNHHTQKAPAGCWVPGQLSRVRKFTKNSENGDFGVQKVAVIAQNSNFKYLGCMPNRNDHVCEAFVQDKENSEKK